MQLTAFYNGQRERAREMEKRVHSSMANKPRQKCCPSVASLPTRAAERESRARERAKSFAVHDVNYNSSKTSAALALGTHTRRHSD